MTKNDKHWFNGLRKYKLWTLVKILCKGNNRNYSETSYSVSEAYKLIFVTNCQFFSLLIKKPLSWKYFKSITWKISKIKHNLEGF